MAYNYGNYPMNSGPPPPPMGGAYAGYGAYGGGSAYGGAAYPGGGGYGGMNPYQQQQNPYGGGGYSFSQQSGAVPGFTAPAPPMGMMPPMSRQFDMAHHAMQPMQCQMYSMSNMVAQKHPDDPVVQQMKALQDELKQMKVSNQQSQEAEASAREQDYQKQMAELQEQLQKKATEEMESDANAKEQMRQSFVNELMRRQDHNGTFEDTFGVIQPYVKYTADDPVAIYYEQKGLSIVGETWFDPVDPNLKAPGADYDSEFLRNGFKGIGTDEEKVIQICTTRSNAQRNKMLLAYKTSFGRDLIEDIKGELSGDFSHLVLALFETPARYDAYSVKKAIYGLGTDEAALIEIMFTRTNAQLNEMAEQYNQITYENLGAKGRGSLEKDIIGDTSGDFKRLLVSASTGNRSLITRPKLDSAVEDVTVNDRFTGMFKVNYEKLCDPKRCKYHAEELYKAGEDKWGTDEETFTKIFGVQDYFTLRQVYDEYVKVSQRDIINSVDRETSGNYRKGLCAIAESVKCRPMFFAKKLYYAMKGAGTDDKTLIRIIASRSEIDLVQIKQCFLELSKQTLWNYIKDDTSGDYKKLLLGIVGKN